MGEFEDITNLANQIKSGKLHRIRFRIPRWAKHVHFDKLYLALTSTFRFDKSLHLACSTRSCQNVRGPATNFFILDLKDKDLYDRMLKAKVLKVQEQSTTHTFEILPDADTSNKVKENPVVIIVTGVDPILAASKIVEAEISKYFDFSEQKVVRNITKGSMSITADSVKVLIPKSLSFISSDGLVQAVEVTVTGYKVDHMSLGALPLEATCKPGVSTDWEVFSESQVKTPDPVVVYCTYCKSAGHTNTQANPCPMLVERDRKSTCTNCKKLGHITRLCPQPKACTFCTSTSHVSEDFKTCNRQYYPKQETKYGFNRFYRNHPLLAKYDSWLSKQNTSKSTAALELKNYAPLHKDSNSPVQVSDNQQIRNLISQPNLLISKPSPPPVTSITIDSSSDDEETQPTKTWSTIDTLAREQFKLRRGDETWSDELEKNELAFGGSKSSGRTQRVEPSNTIPLQNKFQSLFDIDQKEIETTDKLVVEVNKFITETADKLDPAEKLNSTTNLQRDGTNSEPVKTTVSTPLPKNSNTGTANKKRNHKPKKNSALEIDWAKSRDDEVSEMSSLADDEKEANPTSLTLNPPQITELPSDFAPTEQQTKSTRKQSKPSKSISGLIDKRKIERNAARSEFLRVFSDKRCFDNYAKFMEKNNFSYLITEANCTHIINKCNELGNKFFRENVKETMKIHIDTVRQLAAAQSGELAFDYQKLPPCKITKTKKVTLNPNSNSKRTRNQSLPSEPISVDRPTRSSPRLRRNSVAGEKVSSFVATQELDLNFSGNNLVNFGVKTNNSGKKCSDTNAQNNSSNEKILNNDQI